MTRAVLPSPSFQSRSRRVLVAGFAGSFFAVGFSMYLFGVFQNAMVDAFDTSVSVFSWAPSLFAVISGVLAPFVGRALTTRGRPGLSIRSVLIAGAVSIGVGLVLLSRAGSMPVAALIFGLLIAPGAVLLGPLVTQAMVTNWFEARRGLSLGIVAAGTTVAGGVVPVVAAALIEAFGWRDALSILGIAMLSLPLPIVALFARTSPEEVGEQPDGLPATPQTGDAPTSAPQSIAQLLRNPYFWIAGVMFGLQFSAGTLSVIFTVPYAEQLGLSLVASATVLALRSWFGALGKIVLGRLSDHLGVRRVIFGIYGLEILLTLLMIQTRDPILFASFGVGLGFVGAAMLPLKGALVAELFGRASFASAFGLLQTVALPFQPLMVPLAGYAYDATGDYAFIFGGTIPLFVVAALLLLCLKPKPAAEAVAAPL